MGNRLKSRLSAEWDVAVGERIYGLGVMALGLYCLAWGNFDPGQPVPKSFPDRTALAYVAGAVLLIAGAAVQLRRTRELAQVVARMAAPSLARTGAERLDGAQKTLDILSASPEILDARITDLSGRALAAYPRDRATAPGTGRSHVTLTSDISLDGRKLGTLQVVDASRDLSAALPRYLAVTGSLLFGSAGLALLVGRRLARNVVDPISRLSDLMRTVARSRRLDARAPKTTEDEVGVLTDAFNTLLDRLSEHDTALRRTMADLITARDAADDANRLKSEFLANMSHEIRTPLNGILAMAQVMAADDLLPGQRDRLAIVRQSGDSLLDVLNDILDVAKIEAGRIRLDFEELTLDSMLAEAIRVVSARAQDKQLELVAKILPELALRADRRAVKQIVLNLISNALKFTPAGGLVTVSLSAIAGALELSVADSGLGIAEEDLARIGQPFEQAGAADLQARGTGLGLSLVRAFAELHGGEMAIESRLGEGTAVTVRLPVLDAPEATGETGHDGREFHDVVELPSAQVIAFDPRR